MRPRSTCTASAASNPAKIHITVPRATDRSATCLGCVSYTEPTFAAARLREQIGLGGSA